MAAVKYPWVHDYRERAVTELEFLHGHLRDPGKRAACFFFRDKVSSVVCGYVCIFTSIINGKSLVTILDSE